MRSPSRQIVAAVALLAVASLLAACGDDDREAATGAPTTGPSVASTTAPSATAPNTTAADPTTTDANSASTTAGPARPATVSTADTDLGRVLVDANGFTLYGLVSDTGGEPTCVGGCAEAWPPATVDGDVVAAAGLDPSLFSVVDHPEAGPQLAVLGQPLYRFAGDTAPGDTSGQGVADVWFAAGADGALIGAPGGSRTQPAGGAGNY
jgi:predicted lipoprotein with Yx(FWY)xxD motif